MTYRTFKRSARNFEEFASAEKLEEENGLTLTQARADCAQFNATRSAEEIAAGTKLEFERED